MFLAAHQDNANPADCGGNTMRQGDGCVTYVNGHQVAATDLAYHEAHDRGGIVPAYVGGTCLMVLGGCGVAFALWWFTPRAGRRCAGATRKGGL